MKFFFSKSKLRANWNHLKYSSFGNILELIDEYDYGARIDFSLLYESPYIQYQEDEFEFQVEKYYITLKCISYHIEPPPPTHSPPFTYSSLFTS